MRAYNAPTGDGYYPVRPCPQCDAPVIVTARVVLDTAKTTTGPWTRLGFRRHPNEIATSVYHQREDGYRAHDCDNNGDPA